MDFLEKFRNEIYEPLGIILEKEGDAGFISQGPILVKSFYEKYSEKLCSLDTKHAEKGYTRKKITCDDGKHAVRCMEWCPNASSSIHEHGKRPCFDILLEGKLDVVDYRPEEIGDEKYNLRKLRKYSVSIGDFVIVDPINSETETHEIINRSERSKSLHFYPIDHRSLGVYEKLSDRSYRYRVRAIPND